MREELIVHPAKGNLPYPLTGQRQSGAPPTIVIDIPSREPESPDYSIKAFLKMILLFTLRSYKTFVWIMIGVIGLYIGLQLIFGFLALIEEVRDEIGSVGTTLEMSFGWAKYLVAVLLLSGASLFFLWAYRKTRPQGPVVRVTGGEGEGWLEASYNILVENKLYVVIGIIMFHLVLYFTFPEWFKEHIFGNPQILKLEALLIGFSLMAPKGKTPFHHKLGKIGVGVTIIAMLVVIFWKPASGYWTARATATTTYPLSSTISRVVVQKATNEFWYSHRPPAEARVMVDIAQAESGFRQFNEDMSVFRGLENPADVGVMQVNEETWGKEAKKQNLDIYSLDGNLKMALWILTNSPKGVGEWNTLEKVKTSPESVEIIIAPVGSRSRVIPVRPNCHGVSDRLVTVWDDKGNPYDLSPTQIPTFVSTTVAYSTPSMPPGKVEYRCR